MAVSLTGVLISGKKQNQQQNISENSRKLYVANLANDVHCNFPPETLMNTVSSYEAAYWLGRISYNFLIWYMIKYRGCTCRVVDAICQSVDANSIITWIKMISVVHLHTLYWLTYKSIMNQSPQSHSTSLLLTLACSLVKVTATGRWEEATALQLHLTAHHCCVLCNPKVPGFHCIYPKLLNLL